MTRALHPIDRGHANYGAENNFAFPRIAAGQRLHLGDEFLRERVGHLFVDDDAFGRHADLPLIHECAEGGGIDGGIEVGVVEDDERRLAAEFEKNRLQMFRRG